MKQIFAHFFTPYHWLWLSFLLSAALLLGALGFEHIGGMAPCTMCYWQRHAHRVVMVLALMGLIIHYFTKNGNNNAKSDQIFAALIGLAFLVSFGLAFWHTGVE